MEELLGQTFHVARTPSYRWQYLSLHLSKQMMRRSVGNAGENSSWKELQWICFAQIFPNLVRIVSSSNELYTQPKSWDNVLSCLPTPFPFPPRLPAWEQRGKGPPCKLTWNTYHTLLLNGSTMVNTKWITEDPDHFALQWKKKILLIEPVPFWHYLAAETERLSAASPNDGSHCSKILV